MHKSGNVSAALSLNGHDVSAVALSYDRVAQILLICTAADDFVKSLASL